MKLRLPQIRVLRSLAEGQLLTRNKICRAAGFSTGSGTLNYALNGMKVSKANPRPHPGLVELGLITKIDLDIDGVVEVGYRITEEGLAALEEYGVAALPPTRDKEVSTNRRYQID
jgi:hypothetical protein